MSRPLFEIRDVRYDYRASGQVVSALAGVTLDLPRGQVVCLSGPSGSGKSTLLNLLGLLDVPKAGEMVFDGKPTTKLSEREKEKLRLHRLGFVFQAFNLFPTLTAEENVEYFLVKQGVPRAERRRRVEEALAAVGILDQRRKRPHQMSGGQRQRVAIARTLAKKPDLILADEPTASLDQRNGRELMEVLRGLRERFALSVVIASHDPMVIEKADRNVRMEDGRVKEGAYH